MGSVLPLDLLACEEHLVGSLVHLQLKHCLLVNIDADACEDIEVDADACKYVDADADACEDVDADADADTYMLMLIC